ncbi:unnamed protein product [Caenorhabditis sp. 36 PRJEB53466]|nr:unnamed protein product [Caenorhabditis sp. 36 PRJEB53466]
MTEAVTLKRPRSPTNRSEEPDEKYMHMAPAPIMLNPVAGSELVDSATRGAPAPPPPFSHLYWQMLHQMQQHQQMELPMVRKEREDESTSTPSSRRQTVNAQFVPRPIRVPTQPFLNPLPFGILPQHLALPPSEVPAQSPPPARPISPQHIYNVPSFQRADEEIYSKFVESVRKLAAKLTATEKS